LPPISQADFLDVANEVQTADVPVLDRVVCGHTHMQFDRAVGKTRVVQLPHTSSDLTSAAERVRTTGYP
jgi:hypothetical protein